MGQMGQTFNGLTGHICRMSHQILMDYVGHMTRGQLLHGQWVVLVKQVIKL